MRRDEKNVTKWATHRRPKMGMEERQQWREVVAGNDVGRS
jgi:hypothetical protein